MRHHAALAEGRASIRAAIVFDEIELGLLRLESSTQEQEVLRARLLSDIDEITDLRAARSFRATVAPPAFLYVAVLGFLCTMGMLGVHEAGLRSVMLMGFYCAFVGVVIYFILSLSHPFEGIARVTPEAFEVLWDSAQGAGIGS